MNCDHGWVLKGGTNLYCRIPGARHTRDLDLYRQDDPTSYRQATDDLVETMHETGIGPYRFTVTAPKDETVSGVIESMNLTVEVFHGVSLILVFGIDVSGDLQVPTVTDTLTVERSDRIDLEFVGREYTIRSYPIENQIADKIAAMYELHGHSKQPSTRYRDLYDIALIALELGVDAADLANALRTQEQVRSLTLPQELRLPSSTWVDGYASLVKNVPNPREEITEVNEALRIAGALVNPVLAASEDTVTGTWSPSTGRWWFAPDVIEARKLEKKAPPEKFRQG
ncbi:nucleotidyl transferase AbiEii/AbiGii toxin family protein [Corynebacterium cystitidis]|uniref:nucleotidyl transferase AbiEii/AbiGii toxin family protein n=1 Tax=Corynebacterium cystitidis TaxID=35757 RepID=UPI00211E8AB0|nr:nucleotidyl transferase AbiEii/AbiGii toxin family protein [Corynebacterium cystitidis]